MITVKVDAHKFVAFQKKFTNIVNSVAFKLGEQASKQAKINVKPVYWKGGLEGGMKVNFAGHGEVNVTNNTVEAFRFETEYHNKEEPVQGELVDWMLDKGLEAERLTTLPVDYSESKKGTAARFMTKAAEKVRGSDIEKIVQKEINNIL